MAKGSQSPHLHHCLYFYLINASRRCLSQSKTKLLAKMFKISAKTYWNSQNHLYWGTSKKLKENKRIPHKQLNVQNHLNYLLFPHYHHCQAPLNTIKIYFSNSSCLPLMQPFLVGFCFGTLMKVLFAYKSLTICLKIADKSQEFLLTKVADRSQENINNFLPKIPI